MSLKVSVQVLADEAQDRCTFVLSPEGKEDLCSVSISYLGISKDVTVEEAALQEEFLTSILTEHSGQIIDAALDEIIAIKIGSQA
jgi:hypothetical protein